ncbi:hypothetical protein D3C81_1111690 [compost metagenome]
MGIQCFALKQNPKVEIVLQAAVSHAKQRNGMEFFRNNRVDWIGPQPWRWQIVEQHRIGRLHRPGCYRIPESDICVLQRALASVPVIRMRAPA